MTVLDVSCMTRLVIQITPGVWPLLPWPCYCAIWISTEFLVLVMPELSQAEIRQLFEALLMQNLATNGLNAKHDIKQCSEPKRNDWASQVQLDLE